MAKVMRIERSRPALQTRKKVAAYARISMETERLHHSLSAQISYYSSLIQNTPGWQYAGVFVDDGISGTGIAKRDGFQSMVQAADNGEIDIILTKSIQRFARNTVDLLNTVRHLRDIGVEVRFEKEHISTMTGDGELMLTILASFAQEESRSISDNVRWGIRKRMKKGIPNGRVRAYGYRWEGDELVIVPEEAAVVRRIFQNFLDGKSRRQTEKEFAAEGIRTRNGKRWQDSNIKMVLTNITYTGSLLLMKEYISDPITKKHKKNGGELTQYYVEGTHPAIIDKETFDLVQAEMRRRKEQGEIPRTRYASCFKDKIKCPACGLYYQHTTRYGHAEYWLCCSHSYLHKPCGIGGSLNQNNLKQTCAVVLGLDQFDEDVFLDKVEFICVPKRNVLEFHLKDGMVVTKECPNTGRKDHWTPEYKAWWMERRRILQKEGEKE